MKKFNHWTLAACCLLAFLCGKLCEHIIDIIGWDYINHLTDWVYVVLFVIFTAVYIVYHFWFGKKAEENNSDKVEQAYRFPVGMTVASVSIAAILILSGIIAPLMKGEPGQVDNETITSFYTAFIALCTTFVVGFQIYNSIDLHKKMEKLDAAKLEMEKQLADLRSKLMELDSDKEEFEKEINATQAINKKCEYFNAYSIGTIRYNEAEMNKKEDPKANKRYCWNATRAYFNALRFASEGGQDYREAWESFGNKIWKCIDVLYEVHVTNKHGKNDGDKASVMPSYEDRMRYIEDINKAIEGINEVIENSTYKSMSQNLVRECYSLEDGWNEFLTKFYPNVKQVVRQQTNTHI